VAIRTDIHAHIGEVVIDRPPVNALDSEAWNELAAVIANMGSRPGSALPAAARRG